MLNSLEMKFAIFIISKYKQMMQFAIFCSEQQKMPFVVVKYLEF